MKCFLVVLATLASGWSLPQDSFAQYYRRGSAFYVVPQTTYYHQVPYGLHVDWIPQGTWLGSGPSGSYFGIQQYSYYRAPTWHYGSPYGVPRSYPNSYHYHNRQPRRADHDHGHRSRTTPPQAVNPPVASGTRTRHNILSPTSGSGQNGSDLLSPNPSQALDGHLNVYGP